MQKILGKIFFEYFLFFCESERPKPASEIRKKYRNNAQYSLDADDGIEEETLVRLFEENGENERLKERLKQAMKLLTCKQKKRFYEI